MTERMTRPRNISQAVTVETSEFAGPQLPDYGWLNHRGDFRYTALLEVIFSQDIRELDPKINYFFELGANVVLVLNIEVGKSDKRKQ